MNTIGQLNTFSDSSVTYSDQSTSTVQTLVNRYQINGLLDTAQPVMSNIDKICSAAGSWLGFDVHTGKWGVIINTTGTSVASFSDKNIIGNISLSGTGLTNLYNDVKVQFPHRELKDSADFVGISIPSIDRNANEENNTLNLTYDIINDPIQAQLLGFIELKQSRVDLVIKFQTDFSYIGLKAGEIIDVLDSRISPDPQLYRIITISEIQDDSGSLIMEITALSYDPSVYSTADLYKYTRRDTNGIITIGSIGIPGTPSVTKIEVDARPRVNVTSLSPTGIVEGMEFWITTDTSLSEPNRSYRLVGIQRPTGGGVYSPATSVLFSYDSIGSGNFLIKSRGFNSTTVGPFSDPSGFVFTPVQTTQAVDANTAMSGIVGALTLLELLNLVNGLFNNDTGANSLWKKVFDLFTSETGTDLVASASSGTIVTPATSVIVKDEGATVSSSATYIDFVGTGVNVVSAGGGVIVQVNCCGTGGSGGGGSGSTGTATACSLKVTSKYPPDRTTYQDPTTGVTSDKVPVSGNFYISYSPINVSTSTVDATAFGALTKGSGLIKLYKSDGTLAQQMSPGSVSIDNDTIILPFADREYGTDYYILMDEGFVKYCECPSPEISQPNVWNFNTPLYAETPYSVSGTAPSTPATSTATISSLYITSFSLGSCAGGSMKIVYNKPIHKNSGNFYVKKQSDNTLQATIPVDDFTVSGQSLTLATTAGLIGTGITYYLQADAGVVSGLDAGDDCYVAQHNNPSDAITSTDYLFNIAGSLILTGYIVSSAPITSGTTDNNRINPQTNIGLRFNTSISFATAGTITIYKEDASVHQAIDITTSFDANKTNELIWIDADGILWLNPTKDLDLDTTYYVTATGDCVKDSCNNVWGGTSDTFAIRFKTDAGPGVSSPSISGDIITLPFDREVAENYDSPGPIQILDSSNNVLEEIYPGNPAITIT